MVLRAERSRLEGEITVERDQVARLSSLAAQLDDEARECLRDTPPRFSGAAAFRAQASECRGEACQSEAAIWAAQEKIRRIEAELARLRSAC